MSAYGTVTRSAPAGRRPPKPSHQTKSFMKKQTGIGACAKDTDICPTFARNDRNVFPLQHSLLLSGPGFTRMHH